MIHNKVNMGLKEERKPKTKTKTMKYIANKSSYPAISDLICKNNEQKLSYENFVRGGQKCMWGRLKKCRKAD